MNLILDASKEASLINCLVNVILPLFSRAHRALMVFSISITPLVMGASCHWRPRRPLSWLQIGDKMTFRVATSDLMQGLGHFGGPGPLGRHFPYVMYHYFDNSIIKKVSLLMDSACIGGVFGASHITPRMTIITIIRWKFFRAGGRNRQSKGDRRKEEKRTLRQTTFARKI